jgi:hypothetical protein
MNYEPSTNNQIWQQPNIINWSQILLDSFRDLLGYELISRQDTPSEQAQALFLASFVVVSHGTQADPILNYGNQTALKLWELDWAAFTNTPSRLTAEPVDRQTRAMMLQQATLHGYIDNYSGVRISSTGKKFKIDRAIIWNLADSTGNYCGQAATFAHWQSMTND